MADIEIDDLPSITPAGTDLVPLQKAGAAGRATLSAVLGLVAGTYHAVGGTDVPVTDGGTGASTAADARTNLGLVLGTDVQAYSAVLAATTASFTTADETKLDGVETAATADQSDVEIETAYNNQVAIVSQVAAEAGTSTTAERWTPQRVAQAIAALESGGGATNLTWTAATSTVASDTGTDAVITVVDATNPGLMTVALKSKLDAIEAAADVTDATNVTAAGAHMSGGTDVPITDGGTGSSTAAAARTALGVAIGSDVQAYAAVLDSTTAAYTTALNTKLSGIEALADVTDVTNVTAAGALMDSEVDADIKTLSLPASTTISAFGATLVDDANAAAALTTLGAAASGHTHALTDASDVTITTPTTGQVVKYNGTTWINDSDATGGGGGPLEDATDVTITAKATGDILRWNGTAWVDYADSAYATSGHNHSGTYHEVGGTDVPVTDGGTGGSTAAAARTNLGVAIGSDVQAYSAVLAATTASFTTADETKLDGIETAADVTDVTNVTAAGALMDSEVDANLKTLVLPATTTISAFGATLVDDAAASNARTTLGLGSLSTASTINDANWSGTDLAVANGGTGSSTAAAARTALGLVIGTDVQAYSAANATTATRLDQFANPTANLDINDQALLQVGPIESRVETVASTGATKSLDSAEYGVFDMTMNVNCTFSFTNPAVSGEATSFVLILRGAFTPTLPAAVDWADATAPTYTTPSIYSFTTVDGGTTWLGAQVGKAFG